MAYKKIIIPEVGEVLLERSHRAKHLNLSMRPFKGARVAVPRGVPFSSAEQFARSKAEWIRTRAKSMEQIELRAKVLRNVLPFEKEKARRHIIHRLKTLSREHGFSYNRVFIRNQKTRWGSCSAANNINLNINLVLLPAELMDYIILHELAHTRVKNHGPEFWRMLEKIIDNPRQLDCKLDRYRALPAVDAQSTTPA
ncbi:MAG: M48 family metallopeptidase [Desulfobacteraceae bacterium]|nr:M48 family metallopeptidase [Desulfobacteraceae bacterium]